MRRNITLLMIYNMCMATFIVPVIALYYRDEIGLNFRDLLIGEAFFAVTLVLLEVPSGWLSDVWNRKYVLMLSLVFEVLAIGALMAADSFWMSLVAQGLFGVAISLMSGTNTALLYDSLLAIGQPSQYKKLDGLCEAMGLYAIGGMSVFAGYFYSLDHDLLNYINFLFLCFGMVATLLMVEPPRHKKVVEHHPLRDMMITIRYALRGHMEVGAIILFSGFLLAATRSIFWLQQSYYMEMNLPETYYGFLIAICFFLGGFGFHASHWLDRFFSSHLDSLRIILILAMAGSAIAGIHVGWHGVIVMIFCSTFLYGLAQPQIRAAINNRVESHRRATILSTSSLVQSLLFIVLSVVAGMVHDRYGVSGGLYSVSVWLMISGLVLIVWGRRKKSPR